MGIPFEVWNMKVFLSRTSNITSEANSQDVVFKVIQHESREPEESVASSMPFNLPQTPETHTALNILSKLNLPIEKERLDFLKDLLSWFSAQTLLHSEESSVSFPESFAKYISSGFIEPEKVLLEHFQYLDDHETQETDAKSKADLVKDYMALKVLNLAHKKTQDNNIIFFMLPIPVYDKIFLKVYKDSSSKNAESPVKLSFIINTKNLGQILVDLSYLKGKVFATSTFENKKAMDLAKRALSMRQDFSSILKTMQLKFGKISRKDFFFGDIDKQEIMTGVNIRI